MANYLQDLSLGLRQAAGVLNPQISKDVFAADERKENLHMAAEERRQTLQQQFLLQQATPQAAMARQQLENEIGYRQEISKLPQDASIGERARVAEKYGKPELAVSLYNAQEQRATRAQAAKEAIDARIMSQTQAHEARMEAINLRRDALTDKTAANAASQAETARHNAALETLNAQNAQASQELRRLSIDLQRDKLTAAGGGAGLSGEAAGKVAMADQAILDIQGARSVLIVGDGVDRQLVAAMNVPFTAGMPFNAKARTTYSQLQNAVAAKLRIETGAAATESEVRGIMDRFLPKVSDPDSVVKNRLDRLEEFMNTTIDQTKGVRVDQLRSRQGKSPTVKTITSDAEYDALPSGAEFIDPEGKKRRKP